MRYVTTANRILSIAVLSVLAGCAVGPDYQRPDLANADTFATVEGAQFRNEEVERDFWRGFNDAQLNELIEEALVANHDVRIALARLREARALRGEARLDFAAPLVAQRLSFLIATTRGKLAEGAERVVP